MGVGVLGVDLAVFFDDFMDPRYHDSDKLLAEGQCSGALARYLEELSLVTALTGLID